VRSDRAIPKDRTYDGYVAARASRAVANENGAGIVDDPESGVPAQPARDGSGATDDDKPATMIATTVRAENPLILVASIER
jgi:hypothetical protein